MAHDHARPVVGAVVQVRYLRWALGLILAFMATEVAAGIIASSLALLTDAAHMLTDAAAIGLALVAVHLMARPAHGNFTFGYRRVEILAAQANGLALLLLCVWFVYEAVRRLQQPPGVRGWLVVTTALAGIGVNLAGTWLVGRANRASLNVEGAFQHIVNDLYAFVATALAGVVIVATGWQRADALASLVVAALMAYAGTELIRASWRVFLEAAPEDIDVAVIDAELHGLAGVVDVHDLHVWEVSSGFPALSAHVLVAPERDCHAARLEIAEVLHERFGIEHTTLQVDHPAEQQVFPASDLLRRPEDAP